MDYGAMFGIHVPPLELVIRGTAMYWFLFLLMRFVIRRDTGALGIADVLLLVVMADAAQNGMAGEYNSITEGCILLATIVGWNMLLDWLSYKFPAVNRFTTPRALPLVRHGRFLKENLKRERLTPDEVMTKLREQGVAHLRDVQHAYLESDGNVSVLRYEKPQQPEPPPPQDEVPGVK
jgi:uncharacterized membrane protein YcaP (DUF421 family)